LVAGSATAVLLAGAATASAQSGGTIAPGGDTAGEGTAPAPTTGRPGRAILKPNGKAVAPAGAPAAVVNAIAAGNRIRKKPYIYGGGHRSFEAAGYDCSGAVSYVLNAAGFLSSPMPSGSFTSWGLPGKGRWITVYAHGGHAYVVVAGYRFDTSMRDRDAPGPSTGPRWSRTLRTSSAFVARHPSGY